VRAILWTAFVGVFVLLVVVEAVRSYHFRVEVEDYLKLAADAPTVERADEFLQTAIAGIERRGLASGNTALFFRTPRGDLAVWYGQVVGARETTSSIVSRVPAASQLERDNALMKVREVLLDEGERGTTVTVPECAIFFPVLWAFVLGWVVVVLLGVCAFVLSLNEW
jgi:hypothetical protein